MKTEYLFIDSELKALQPDLAATLGSYADSEKMLMYLLCRPLGDRKYAYDYEGAAILLVPNHKIMILNLGRAADKFEDFTEDLLEDLASISDKFNYKDVIGRVRHWRDTLVQVVEEMPAINERAIQCLLQETQLEDPKLGKHSELLVSLLIGSINDIDRVGAEPPQELLDKIKQKIVLFDGDQTRFIYDEPTDKVTVIQGLSGTGKTELLLHKLKELYQKSNDSRILFTCHNRILAANLRERIPDFFTFMKVGAQIKWQERLWCIHAWGSRADPNSGAYRFICSYYDLPFEIYSQSNSFDRVCNQALELIGLENLVAEKGFAFDFTLVDEIQDLPKSFIELCKLVTREKVFVAGDIFQSIFDSSTGTEVNPHYLLNRCYRTDPRTLMFAHGLGMGLFEEQKLQWLDQEDWQRCGYKVDSRSKNQKYILSRDPVKRFEDVNTNNASSVKIVQVKPDLEATSSMVIDLIRSIQTEHPTVGPDDIGIIFLSNSIGYKLASFLDFKIPELFNWQVNRAYVTKDKIENTLFVSNQNNVKGLEFPFVICLCPHISNYKHSRNALYMALTRSFIHSWLILAGQGQESKIERIDQGLSFINENFNMEVDVPSPQEQESIRMRIDTEERFESFEEILDDVFSELEVPQDQRVECREFIKGLPKKLMNRENAMKYVEIFFEQVHADD